MKKAVHILLIVMMSLFQGWGQSPLTIRFDYDDAGNRTKRYLALNADNLYVTEQNNLINAVYTATSGSFKVNATANTWTISGVPSWATVSQSSGSASAVVTVNFQANTGTSRSATLTLTSESSQVPAITINISQEAMPVPTNNQCNFTIEKHIGKQDGKDVVIKNFGGIKSIATVDYIDGQKVYFARGTNFTVAAPTNPGLNFVIDSDFDSQLLQCLTPESTEWWGLVPISALLPSATLPAGYQHGTKVINGVTSQYIIPLESMLEIAGGTGCYKMFSGLPYYKPYALGIKAGIVAFPKVVPIAQAEANDIKSIIWRITEVNGYKKIMSSTHKYLGIAGKLAVNLNSVVFQDYTGEDHQLWKISRHSSVNYAGANYYTIENKIPNWVMFDRYPAGGSPNTVTDAYIAAKGTSTDQSNTYQWVLEPVACPSSMRKGVKEVEISSRLQLKVSPNPTFSIAKVSYYLRNSGEVKMLLLNSIGQPIYSETLVGKTGANQKDINLGQQASGNYILQISTTEGKKSIKITKK